MTTTNNFENALDKMIESSFGSVAAAATTSTASLPNKDQPKFIKTPTWQGNKPGYYFGTSDQGTGYYWDIHQQSSKQQPQQTATNKNKRKRVMINEDQNQIKTIPAKSKKLSGEDLLKEAEQAVDEQNLKVMELTVRGVHTATTQLQKLCDKNSLQRVKYANDPAQYMNSELALHDQITSFKSIAANPIELYADSATGLSSVTVPLLAGLLSHDNSDIASSVMNVFVEWLDPTLLVDNLTSSTTIRSDFQHLAKTVMEQCLDVIIGNLGRFTIDLIQHDKDDNDDEQNPTGVEDTLTWVEHMLELDTIMEGNLLIDEENDVKEGSLTSVASKVLNDTLFLSWLLPHATDSTSSLQGRAAEVMSFLLQHEDAPKCVKDISALSSYQSMFDDDDDDTENQTKTNGKTNSSDKKKKKNVDGLELILQTIASWRKKQPSTEEECEILENLCLTLASCLFSPTNVERFLEAQGPELVLRCLKERVHAGGAALKLLDFMGSDPIYQKACEQMVEAGGLKYIFPIFMGRSIPKPAPCSDAGKKKIQSKSTTTLTSQQQQKHNKKIQHARKEWLQKLEDSVIRIVYSLTRHIQPNSPNDAFERLLVKFLEADCEKCDRLVELCLKYDGKSRTAEYNFYRTTEEEDLDDDEQEGGGSGAVEFAALNAKLKGGGDLFHRLGSITAFACVGSKRCHKHILKQLTLQKSGIGTIKASIEEFVKMLGRSSQKDQLEKYLSEI